MKPDSGLWILSAGQGILRIWKNDEKLRGGQGKRARGARSLKNAARKVNATQAFQRGGGKGRVQPMIGVNGKMNGGGREGEGALVGQMSGKSEGLFIESLRYVDESSKLRDNGVTVKVRKEEKGRYGRKEERVRG